MKIKKALILALIMLMGISVRKTIARGGAYLVETYRFSPEFQPIQRKNAIEKLKPRLVCEQPYMPHSLMRMKPKHLREKKRRMLMKARLKKLESQITHLEQNMEPLNKALFMLQKKLKK